MMSKFLIFMSFTLLLLVSFTGDIHGSMASSVVEEEIEVSNHKILGVVRTYTKEAVLLLDEGSSWLIKERLNEEERESLIGAPVSFMPKAGKDKRDRFIAHLKNDTRALDVERINYSRYGCHKIADIYKNQLTIYLGCNGETKTFYVSEDSLNTLSKWSEGDPILVGGIWFGEFDEQGREVPACISFTLYNYRKQKFVRTFL